MNNTARKETTNTAKGDIISFFLSTAAIDFPTPGRVYFGSGVRTGWLPGVPVLRASCFNLRTCVRWLLDNRRGFFILLALFTMMVYSLLFQ
jgi:hypothetical protein